MEFRGQTVVITGGAGNLGRATADAFAAEGARRIILDQLAFLGTDGVTRGEVETLLELVKLKRSRTVVGEVLALDQAARAHELLEARGATGRVVLAV